MPRARSPRPPAAAPAAAHVGRINELKPDPKNANRGTERGGSMVENSLRSYGAGRSVVVDRHGTVIAGNKTVEAAAAIDMNDIVVVESDGSKLVVVKRTDLDLERDIRAKELAIADNRAGQVGLKWDVEVLQSLADEGVQINEFFREGEWDALLEESAEEEPAGEEIPEMGLKPFEEYNYIVVLFRTSQDWQGACEKLGIRREAVNYSGRQKVGLGRVIDGERLVEKLR